MSLLAFSLLIIVLAALSGSDEGEYGIIWLAPVVGAVVLEHIGWAFGAYIPILLGFYAIVIGGQLVADPVTAARTRRTLGFAAEAMTAALVPALVLIVAACFADPSQVGALFVITPVIAGMLFLATQLGRFIVFEPALLLASANLSRTRTKARLKILKRRSREPIWIVITANSVAAGFLGMITTMTIARPAGSAALLLVLYVLFSLILGIANAIARYTFHTAWDWTSKTMAWLVPIVVHLVIGRYVVELFFTPGPAVGTSALVILLFSAASTLWPRKWSPRPLLDWTIQGAAAGYAAKTLTKTYVANVRKIRELSQTTATDGPGTLRARMHAALRALRGDVPLGSA